MQQHRATAAEVDSGSSSSSLQAQPCVSKVDSDFSQHLVADARNHVEEQEEMQPIQDLDQQLAQSLAGLRRGMHYWEQRQALSGAPGNSSSSWRIQDTQPVESASPGSTSTSIGEKPERRKRKLEVEETSAKPYACRFCSQSFDKSQALGGHMNRHRQEREREQLDNAQKLVLKQQGLQGFTGLPLQNMSPRSKLQGPTSIVSIDQVTLSRYNSQAAVQYQNPRSYLPSTYSSLHSSGALLNAGAWNLGGYVGGGGCTGSIASGTSLAGQLDTSSGDSTFARVIQAAATPEDLFAASVLQSGAAQLPSSLLQGRTMMATSDTAENEAEQEMMYGYPGMSNLTATQTEASCTSPPDKFNFSSVRHSFETVIQAGPGNVTVQPLYSGVQAADHATVTSQVPLHVASDSPPDPLGQMSDQGMESETEQDIKYGYSGVSTLTQPDLEASTSGSDKSPCHTTRFWPNL